VKAGGLGKGKQTIASPLINERFQSLCQLSGFSKPFEMKEKVSFLQGR
jgi:hypothetical protein